MYNSSTDGPEKNRSEKKYLKLNSRSLEYEIWGEGEPFVFLHGMGGGIEQIRKTVDVPEGIQMIVPNQQGHGGSDADWEHYDFDHLADDIIALLEELKIKNAYFAGISMGAAVCLNLAVRHPGLVKKLFLIRNAWVAEPMPEGTGKAYADLGRCLREGSLEAFYQTEGWKLVKASSRYTQDAFTGTFADPDCLKHWKKYLILPGKVPVRSEELIRSLKMPVFILANRNDLSHPFEFGERMHELIPASRFYEIPAKDQDSAEHRRRINEIIHKAVQQVFLLEKMG